MAAVKVNHHVLPRFYLRRFSDSQRQLREYRRGQPLPRKVPVSKATVVPHLYTLDGPDGGDIDLLEDTYGRIESAAARALVEVLDKGIWPVHNSARNHLANWIASQYLRTPRSRKAMESDAQQWRNQLAGLIRYEDIREVLGWPDLARADVLRMWGSMLDYFPAEGNVPRNAHARWFSALLRDFARNVFERDWYLVQYEGPRYLVSDEPIIGLLSSNQIANYRDFPAADRLIMPLDRTTGLLLVNEGRKDGKFRDAFAPQGEEHVSMFNRMLVANATNSVFEHPADLLFPGWEAGRPPRTILTSRD